MGLFSRSSQPAKLFGAAVLILIVAAPPQAAQALIVKEPRSYGLDFYPERPLASASRSAGQADLEQRPEAVPLFTPRRVVGTPVAPGSDLICLSLLAAEGVAFEEAPATEGLAMPVKVKGDVFGGVFYRYYYQGKKPRVVDCRLALALARAGPVLRANGVTEVIFASHYRASLGNLPRGRYHPHAQGLAIDIKGFRVGRTTVLVERDYEPGLGFQEPSSCLGRPMTVRGMLLRKIVCDLDAADVFEAILTPDYDAQHWNHFHFHAFHPADRSQIRPRGTALLEVPMTDLTSWAMRRPLRHAPEQRPWDWVAMQPWPARYYWVRTRVGIPEPEAWMAGQGPPDDDLLLGLWDWMEGLLDRIPPDVIEAVRLSLEEPETIAHLP